MSDDSVGVKILVDLEAQKEESPGYDISERAIYYCCRMISSQLTQEFTNSTADKVKYGNLKKVYSIWICTETAQKRANTIERYKINREVFSQGKNYEEPRYDLLEAIIVNISKSHNVEDTNNRMIRLLTNLFNENIDGLRKVELLKEEYGIRTTNEFEREVSDMTAYTARIIREGMEKGMEKGMQQGIQQGIRQGIQQGMEKGMQQGQNILVEAITRLRQGETPEQIVASGIDQKTVDLAQTIK